MLYYKIMVLLIQQDKSKSTPSRARSREEAIALAEQIATETNAINHLQSGRYLFTSTTSRKKWVLGAVSQGRLEQDWVEEYLQALELEYTGVTTEEVTFQGWKTLLFSAQRNDYVEDDNEILEQFQLRSISRRDFLLQEFLIPQDETDSALREGAKRLLSTALEEELERILKDPPEKAFAGHPVHYILETDDPKVRRNMLKILLRALYSRGRLCSRRVTAIQIDDEQQDLIRSCVGGAMVLSWPSEEEEDDFVRSSVDDIQKAMELMREYQSQVLTVLCLPRTCRKQKDTLLKFVDNCVFVEIREDMVSGQRAKRYLRSLAQEKCQGPDRLLYRKVNQCQKDFLPAELNRIFEDWLNVRLRTKIYPQYAGLQSVGRQLAEQKPQGSAYEKLHNMIGLDAAKEVIDRALNFYKAQKLWKAKGLQGNQPAMHMVFTGNPGTAKTTVARLFAQILKENGVLSEGRLYEVGRADLVGKYVGWTAQIVKNKFKQAKGSVLFIDEAYALLEDRSGLYGDEAINTIVQEMENHREDLVVIFAGYPKEMEAFLARNPGLRSRIAFHLPFEDYSARELYQIARLLAEEKGMSFAPQVEEKLIPIFQDALQTEGFGNGRFARNLVEQAQMKQADRLMRCDLDDLTKDEVTTLLPDDFEPPQKKKIRKLPIGFAV